MKAAIKQMKDLTLYQLLRGLFTSPSLSRFRTLLLWTVISYTPALLIYKGILQWTIYIPGADISANNSMSFVALILGSSFLPILFFLTNGLKGYHDCCDQILNNSFGLFKKREVEVTERAVLDQAVVAVEEAKMVVSFLLLELMIISWDSMLYFFFNQNLSSISFFGFISDSLLLAMLVFVIESVAIVVRGIKASFYAYELKNLFNQEEPDEVSES